VTAPRHRRLLVTALAFAALAAVPATARAGWLEGYRYRQQVTISGGVPDADLAGFPALVRTTDGANHVFGNTASPLGHDVVFTAADGFTRLPHELEHFATGGASELDAWVKTDMTAGAPTVLYMYYGGPDAADPYATQVWDGNYKMVQHLQETSGTHVDSTSHGNNGTVSGATMDAVGKVDGADSFDGSNDYVSCGSDPSLKITGPLTLEGWMRADELDGALHNIVGFSNSEQRGYKLAWDNRNTNRIWFCVNDYRTTPTGGYVYNTLLAYEPLSAEEWYHIAATYDPTKMEVFVNGESVGTRTPTSEPGAYDGSLVYIGRWGSFWFDGQIDEVRISDIARSAEWILANYRLQGSPTDFLEFGAPQTPEPTTMGLLGLGALALLRRRRRRR
jgi:hypothetical protein